MIKKQTIRIVISFLIVYAFVTSLHGCDFLSGLLSKKAAKDTAVENAYKEYRKALKAGDIESLKKLISQERVHELEGDNAAIILKLARSLSPPQVSVTGTYVKGNAATLTASAGAMGSNMKGIVHLLKENGKWKIYEEKWEVKLGMKDLREQVTTEQSSEQFTSEQISEEAVPPSKETTPEGATGEAVIVKDGVKETYPLKTGFLSETRFDNPKRAEIQFQFPGEEFSNARRIEMTLDATKAGTHYADGKAMNDSMFNQKELNIGEQTPDGRTAIFRFVADGGQIFPPKDACVINITSSYTGTPNGVFAGEISNCTVHSAGIDYNISSVIFMMRGVPSH
jgi:hypothetical protein